MKARLRPIVLGVLAVSLVLPLTGCGLFNRFISPAVLTNQQAIAIVQVAGVPYIDDYYQETVGEEAAGVKIGYAKPAGDWTAKYDEGIWQVQGTVYTEKWGNCMTIWTLREQDSKITLTGFSCS